VPDRLLLDEHILADGTHARTYASLAAGDHVQIEDDLEPPSATEPRACGTLSLAALDRVMVRYGRPLDAGVNITGPHLELGGGRRLRQLRFHAVVDAEARDYLIWERPGEEPLAVIARHATAALRYLVLRLSSERSQ
jgi:hypothetical protein